MLIRLIKNYFQGILFSLPLCLFPALTVVSEVMPTLEKAHIDLTDLPSLQRGAKLFINYCAGCHSLKYVRYNELAQGIGIVDASGNILDNIVKANLILGNAKMTDAVITAMTKEEGMNWFGIAPPDLSLVARLRSPDWLYSYLKSFYPDDKKIWGVNNTIFPDVAMPNVLLTLQKRLPSKEFDTAVSDLVNFLTYVSEPHQLERKRLGVLVVIFLGLFFVFTWLLKREYWKEVH
jgi:ubiquinol-cytochrome c reductase cytochrome c1 subunit